MKNPYKYQHWIQRIDKNIINVIKENDLIFIDGTFYDKKELKSTSMQDVPHPSILESIELFKDLCPQPLGCFKSFFSFAWVNIPNLSNVFLG